MTEICEKCGEIIEESKWEIKRFRGNPYHSECYEKVINKFYLEE